MKPHRIHFTPIELKSRHDGWTPARQTRFIEILAATRSITRACGAVGMTSTSAYKLGDRPNASGFRLAPQRPCAPTSNRNAGVRRARSSGSVGWKVALRPKFDEMEEMEATPNSIVDHQPTSSASEILQNCLARLREQEQGLGSPAGG